MRIRKERRDKMITLYTAIGTYKLNHKALPTVMVGETEYGLTGAELLLWSSLSFRILTYQELKREFHDRQKELRILMDDDFDHYLNRLIVRRLVVSGKDITGVDALYNLLGHLHVSSVPNSLPVKCLTFGKLLFFHRVPFKKAVSVFHTPTLDSDEKRVLNLVSNQTLSTAELILCTELGCKSLKDNKELMEVLYSKDSSNYKTIYADGRTSETRIPVLSAIANLYLKQCITFQLV